MKKILAICLFVFLGSINNASAYEMQIIEDTPVKNDFVLGPGKMDVTLNPGGKTVEHISVTNRTGEKKVFKVEVEDFSGSYNEEQTFVLLGETKGKYSLKDYIHPEEYEFTLSHGERIILPIEIEIPFDSEPGGLYASVLVSVMPNSEEIKKNQGKTQLVSRLGTLFFLKVNGDVNESGYLHSFNLHDSKNFYEKGPISFEIDFENEGNVHIAPSGIIEIKNVLGKKIGEVEVDKYFVMPDSLRRRVIEWDKSVMFGFYTANLILDKNYQTLNSDPERMSVSFWVLPWKVILLCIAFLTVIIFMFKKLFGSFKFEIKRK